jgi:two-component system, OmpR family, sensor kinase
MRPRLSLRARLTLVFAAGMIIVSIGVASFVYAQVRGDLRAQVDLGLHARAQALLASGAAGRGLAATSGHLADNDESFAQLLAADGRLLQATRSVRRAPLIGRDALPASGTAISDLRPPGLEQARVLVVPTTFQGHRAYLVVGATLSDTTEALWRLLVLFAVALPGALAVSSLIGWHLAGAALRPVRRMSAEAGAITASQPDRRLHVPTTDASLALLARTVNASFDRLESAIRRERAFVDNASHELRTPLTILKAEVDTALSAPRSAGELNESLESIANEIRHLIRIAEGLLVIARTNDGRIPVERAPIELRELVAESVQAFAGATEAAGIDVRWHAPATIVHLDRTRVRQALDNLIENALRYTPAGGRLAVAGAVSAGAATIAVTDSGCGFADETLARAFQPFNRGVEHDQGAGLGLAITHAIAVAHGGGASVENVEPHGATVTVWFSCVAGTSASDSQPCERHDPLEAEPAGPAPVP